MQFCGFKLLHLHFSNFLINCLFEVLSNSSVMLLFVYGKNFCIIISKSAAKKKTSTCTHLYLCVMCLSNDKEHNGQVFICLSMQYVGFML